MRARAPRWRGTQLLLAAILAAAFLAGCVAPPRQPPPQTDPLAPAAPVHTQLTKITAITTRLR